MKKNICICISGQVRTLLPLHELQCQLKDLSPFYSFTLIFSLWNKSGSKTDGALAEGQQDRIFEKNVVDNIPYTYYWPNTNNYHKFWSHFPKTYLSLKTNNNVDINQIKRIFPAAIFDIEEDCSLDLSFNQHYNDVNSKKMLYKIWRANEIKKSLEKQNNYKYDIVLRMRPDLHIGKINFNTLDNDIVYVPAYNNTTEHIVDTLAISNSLNADYYASLFSKTISNERWSGIHTELYLHLNKAEILLDKIPFETRIASNNLVNLEALIDDNDFFKKLQPIIEKKWGNIELQIAIELSESLLDSGEKAIINGLLFDYLIDNTYEYDLCKLYLFSTEVVFLLDFKNSRRGKYFLDRLGKLISLKLISLKLYTKNDITLIFRELTDEFNKNENIAINLEKIKSSNILFNILVEEVQYNILLNISEKRDFDFLKNIDYTQVEKKCADIFKTIAFRFEKTNINDAYSFMNIALQIRPNGKFIQEKIKEYKKEINKNEKFNY